MQHPVKIISAYYNKHNILPVQTIEYMEYTLISLWNEWIKIIIYWIFFVFLKQNTSFLFILLILYPIRWISGGFHAKTFLGCFIYSFFAILFLIFLPPILPCPIIPFSLFLFVLCLLTYSYVPSTPTFRPITNKKNIYILQCLYITLIIIWIIILNLITHPNKYTSIGFYTLLFQVIQLFASKKGGNSYV